MNQTRASEVASQAPPSPITPASSNPIVERFDQAKSLFDRAKTPADTPGSRRFIHVGYVQWSDGRSERQLVILAYRQTSDFHKKIYFPSRVCATSVTPDNPSEDAAIREAIQILEDGGTPEGNAAYEWAKGYQLEKDVCLPNGTEGHGHRPETVEWALRTTPEQIVFHTNMWNGRGRLMFSAPQGSSL